MSAERLPMRRPLLALTGAYLLGIAIGATAPLPVLLVWALAGALAFSAAGMALAGRGGVLRFWLWLGALVALGGARVESAALRPLEVPDGHFSLVGEARSGWSAAIGGRRLELGLLSVRRLGEPAEIARGGIRLTVKAPQAGVGENVECPPVAPGDRVWALASLRRVRARHNPGVEDGTAALRERGIDALATVRSCDELLVEPVEEHLSLRRGIEHARQAVRRAVQAAPGPEIGRALVLALTIGDAGGVPPELREEFSRSGMAHLLAVSGLHLGIVALGLYWLLRRLLGRWPAVALRWDTSRLAAATVAPVVVGYTLLAGARLPTVRAAVMVGCFLLAAWVRRRSDPLQTLAAAGLLVLGVWPRALFDLSFQMSFAAVAGVLLLLPPLAERLGLTTRATQGWAWWRRVVRYLGLLLLLSLVASLAVAPLTAGAFQQLSRIGPLANLLAVPLAAWLIVPLGLFGALLVPFSAAAAGVVFGAAAWLADALAALAGWFAAPAWAAIHAAAPGTWQLCAWYGTLLALGFAERRVARWVAIAGTLVLALGLGAARIAPLLDDRLTLTYLDVGQGDATLVRLPGGRALLVDGGGSPGGRFDVGRRVVAPTLWAQGIDELDVVALTHCHPDHAGGLPSVLRLFRPRELWVGAPLAEGEDEACAELESVARELGVAVRELHRGLRPLEGPDLSIEVLWPPEGGGLEYEENERSLVLLLQRGARRFLLVGDLEREGERALLQSGGVLQADVLKVGHHGSRHASAVEFLEAVRPRQAIVSVGTGNPWGLPDEETLDRLEAAGARVWRTDCHGAVTVRSDGDSLEIESQVAPGRDEEE